MDDATRAAYSVELVDTIRYDEVDTDDLQMVKRVLYDIVTFEHPMPKLDIDIFKVGDHYNISIKNFSKNVSVLKLYSRFLDESKRPAAMDYVLDIDITPAPDPIFLVQVKRRAYEDARRSVRTVVSKRRR